MAATSKLNAVRGGQIRSKALENLRYPANALCPNCGGYSVEVTGARSVGWSEPKGFLAWWRDPEVSLFLRWLVGIPVWTILAILYLCSLLIAFALMVGMACTILLMMIGGRLFTATLGLPATVLHTWHEDYRVLDARCKLCGCAWIWRTDQPLPAGQADAGLIAAGAARLEQERREEDCRQPEAAWYLWQWQPKGK